jgi:serine beta-lactamase-like protein LACTB, mitochondrial
VFNIRLQTILALMVGGVGLLVAAVLGLFAYMSVTATPLHPNAQGVPSVTRSAPLPRWTGAVEQARRVVRAGITGQNLPALSVAVGVGGDIVWAEGFGWADVDNRVPAAPDTRFRTGGVSMALTSAAVGLLLEKRQLKLDDEIQAYVPAFPKKQWPVTLRQLMAHVAGVRSDGGDEESMAHCGRTADGLPRVAGSDLRFEPGTRFKYSTYGWILVSAAVEAAAREPFVTFMRTQIFEPLGMADTKPDAAAEAIANRAAFYHPRFAGDPRYGPDLAREGDYSCLAGGGAFLSTPSDLVRFGMAMHSGKLLQPATVATLQTAVKLASGEETGYALGWDVENVSLAGQPTQWVGHGGEFTMGGSTSFMTFPDRGIVVAVMTNIGFADVDAVAMKVAEAFAQQGSSAGK